MTDVPPPVPPAPRHPSFAEDADAPEPTLLAEFWEFIVHNKAWWITPIILVLLAVGVLIFLSGTAAAPFIYPLF